MKSYELHKQSAPSTLSFAVITISDSKSKNINEDISGKLIIKSLKKKKHKIIGYEVIPDEKRIIKRVVMKYINSSAHAIITSGGTGVSKRDVTLEALAPLFEKELLGFGELFRFLSYKEIGSSAFLSRATCGICKGKVIFCLPGSPSAVKLGINKLILPETPHLLKHLGL